MEVSEILERQDQGRTVSRSNPSPDRRRVGSLQIEIVAPPIQVDIEIGQRRRHGARVALESALIAGVGVNRQIVNRSLFAPAPAVGGQDPRSNRRQRGHAEAGKQHLDHDHDHERPYRSRQGRCCGCVFGGRHGDVTFGSRADDGVAAPSGCPNRLSKWLLSALLAGKYNRPTKSISHRALSSRLPVPRPRPATP